ncbi:Yip1 family protein [Streptomyces sp. 549]|uniref:Yip1 family protein n=1 Tax=Streptomyces sp. 549 TaxID=3049076 RepID=UPI0024C20F6B|nr:Yip1 family protein [Streptomyces sp. 549]MDK1473135.1 Yip1 family protein [Streptomyces sp. 549]
MAGFRMGRGRHPRNAPQRHGTNPPPGAAPQAPGPYVPYGQQTPPPRHTPHPGGPDPWQQGGNGEPEYFAGQPAHDPYANNPGHTQQFRIGDDHGPGPGDAHGGYRDEYTSGATYAAGHTTAPPAGPRLHWKQLLSGIVLRPNATFWQMRDYAVWGPAILVTFLYGLLAVFGLDSAREDVLGTTFSNAVPYVLITGVAVVLSGLVLGTVTHTLARQFGGDGAWAPTVGLSMLIMSITDAPRLLFALFLGGTAPFVQIVGWITWVAAGALFASMVSRSHDLPWQKALGAASIQLLALLVLIKLGTL